MVEKSQICPGPGLPVVNASIASVTSVSPGNGALFLYVRTTCAKAVEIKRMDIKRSVYFFIGLILGFTKIFRFLRIELKNYNPPHGLKVKYLPEYKKFSNKKI
jgi:hypothetical protein